MAAQSSQTCELCKEHEVSHFCSCEDPPTLFCMYCFHRHFAKTPQTLHHATRIAALGQNLPEYLRKSEAVEIRVAEIRKNLEHIDQCCDNFNVLIESCITYLTDYRSWWLELLHTEKEQLLNAIETALQEAYNCLDQGTNPVGALAQALWTLPPEELHVFSYSITPPDLQSVCQTLASYQNNLLTLCERIKKPTEEARHRPAENSANLFAVVVAKTVIRYDWVTKQLYKGTLSVDFGWGGSFVMVDRHTLVCMGGDSPTTAVYGLHLPSLQLTSMPSHRTPRCTAAVATATHYVYVFGGRDNTDNDLKSCEKYDLQSKQWMAMRDMREKRCCFSTCSSRGLIYLPCPRLTLSIEVFNPDTELFTVLPVALPPKLKGNWSVSFISNEELFILTQQKQMGRLRINSEKKFRLSTTDRECGSTQPALIIDSLALIANGYNGKVEKFSLQTYAFL